MASTTTVADLKDAIQRAKGAIDEVQVLCRSINTEAIFEPRPVTPLSNPDKTTCKVPEMHPGSGACWVQFPLEMGDPFRHMSELLKIMLDVLDTVNPRTQLNRDRDR